MPFMPLTRPRSTSLRAAGVLTGTLVLAVSLTACGGGDDKSGSGGKSDAKLSAQGQPTADPTGIASAPGDINRTTKASTTAVAVPSGGPTGISTFPIPPGVNVKGPGPQENSWQFDITTKDVSSVLAFYRKALPKAGYSIKNNVTHNEGAAVVTYDIEFSGTANGFLVADQSEDDVFVSMQSPPDTTPSPQPGVAGG